MTSPSRPALTQFVRTGRRTVLLLLVVLAVIVVAVVSLGVGSQHFSLAEVVHAVVHGGSSPADVFVRDYRVPRAALALVVGAALGMAGCLVQAVTRNPLAGPGILGVNSGAAISVVIGITFFGITDAVGTIVAAIVGSSVVAVLVFAIGSRFRGSGGAVRLVLVGTAIGATLESITAGINLLNPNGLEQYRDWAIGSVADRGTATLVIALPCVVAGAVIGLLVAPALNAMALGDDVSRSLGVRRLGTLLATGLAITLLCGSATAAAGPIVFVGLLVPHIARLLVGVDHRWTLPLSGLLGALLLLLADVVGRVVAPPGEIQAGIVTAVIGAPVFLVLLRSSRILR